MFYLVEERSSLEKMAKNISEEIDFQLYVDGVKQKTLSWKFFSHLMQDLSHSDIDRLRKLNAILLTELTMNCSQLEKLKYLNDILLIQFKNYIFTLAENDLVANLQESNEDQILNEKTFEETMEEISTDEDIDMPILFCIQRYNSIENRICERLIRTHLGNSSFFS